MQVLAQRRNLHSLKCFTRDVMDISALAACKSLHALKFSECCGVTNVSALAACVNLHTLILNRCNVTLIGIEGSGKYDRLSVAWSL